MKRLRGMVEREGDCPPSKPVRVKTHYRRDKKVRGHCRKRKK
jgi:hypothetical protein